MLDLSCYFKDCQNIVNNCMSKSDISHPPAKSGRSTGCASFTETENTCAKSVILHMNSTNNYNLEQCPRNLLKLNRTIFVIIYNFAHAASIFIRSYLHCFQIIIQWKTVRKYFKLL